MSNKKMVLGVALGDNIGNHRAAWRTAQADPTAYSNVDYAVKQAQTAERGGLQFLFLPDRLFLFADLAETSPVISMEPILTLTAIARETKRIGLIATSSASFNEPYNLARQFKALDVISHRRAGWNAVPSFEPEAFASFGMSLPPREYKYERLHEVIRITQALWGSWGKGAGEPDPSGKYADPAHIKPINLHGRYVGSSGPLPIPPSEQGQPIIMQPASSSYGLQAAAMYADVVAGMPETIAEGVAQRDTLAQAVRAAGRDPEAVKFLAFATFSIGATVREALDRRRVMDEGLNLRDQLSQLGMLLGVPLDPARADTPLTPDQLVPGPAGARHPRARRGRTGARRMVATRYSGSWRARHESRTCRNPDPGRGLSPGMVRSRRLRRLHPDSGQVRRRHRERGGPGRSDPAGAWHLSPSL